SSSALTRSPTFTWISAITPGHSALTSMCAPSSEPTESRKPREYSRASRRTRPWRRPLRCAPGEGAMRLLEISDTEEAAAFAGHLFARWGARLGGEVIRVEAPSRVPSRPAAEVAYHGGKRRWSLDWRSKDGLAALREVAASAEVIVS